SQKYFIQKSTKMKKTLITLGVAVLVFGACKTEKKERQKETEMPNVMEMPLKDNILTDKEKSENWVLLFDGKTADGWRGYNQETLPDGWVVEDGTLKSLGKGGDIGGD